MKSLSALPKDIKRVVNDLQSEHKCVMLFFDKGKLYLLFRHWQHINWKDHSKKLLVAKVQGFDMFRYKYVMSWIP